MTNLELEDLEKSINALVNEELKTLTKPSASNQIILELIKDVKLARKKLGIYGSTETL